MVNTIYINTEYKIEIVLVINYAQLVLNVHLAGLKLGGNCNPHIHSIVLLQLLISFL